MKTPIQKTQIVLLLLALLSTLITPFSTARAQGTAFTYQGRLNAGGVPANGLYDFRFKLYFDPLGNNQAGSSFLTNAIPATNGLFVVAVDFGAGIFTGGNYWLEVDVKTNNAGGYTDLSPYQGVTPTPYAVFANTASNMSGTLSSSQLAGAFPSQLTGTIPLALMPAAVVTNNAGGLTLSGTFSGNGAGVSNVNAAALNGLTATNFWQLGGNTVAPGNYLGSTNNQPVELWVNGARALRLEPTVNDDSHSNIVNVVGGSAANYVQPGTYGGVIAGGGAANYSGSAGANSLASDMSFLGGGLSNSIEANAPYSVLVGGFDNNIQDTSHASFLGGGLSNSIEGNATYSVLVGGLNNLIQTNTFESALVGGVNNSILDSSYASFLGGGSGNSIQGNYFNPSAYCVLVGGEQNSIQYFADWAFLGGGNNNSIQYGGFEAVIAGGSHNTNSGDMAVVPGGYGNYAGGLCSFAAGHQAHANYEGDFVWADSESGDFDSTTND